MVWKKNSGVGECMFIVAEDINEEWIYIYPLETEKEAVYLTTLFDMIKTENFGFYYASVVENDDISVSILAESLEEFLGLVLKAICEERGLDFNFYNR